MIKKLTFAILILIAISFLLSGTFGTYFPSDNLNYLLSFSQNSWDRPHNSLLSDPLYQFDPWMHYAKEKILSGSFPFWNDLVGGGIPFFANPQSAVFFPVNLFYYLLPFPAASWFIPFLKIFLFGFFNYIYLKSLKISFEIRILGVIVLTLSAFFIEWILWPHTSVFLFFPFLLFLAENLGIKSLNHRIYAGIAVTYFAVILGGHPGTIVHLTIIYCFYVVARFWKDKKIIIKITIPLVGGSLLASFFLIPWFEFMLNSYQYYQRFFSEKITDVSLSSFAAIFVPFIFGAPHQEFYRQTSSIYNFQEITAGYVMPTVLLLVLISLIYIRKRFYIKVWLAIAAFCYLVGLNVFPFGEIAKLPPLNGVSNVRLISFGSFAFGILFSIVLQEIKNSNYKLKNSYFKKILISLLFFSILFLFFEKTLVYNFAAYQSQKIRDFYPLLIGHIYLLFFSSLLFTAMVSYILTVKGRTGSSYLFSILAVPILLQSLFLFWNYNSVNSTERYYPETELVEFLKSKPKGSVLEVGNPNLPPNINMVYGLKSAENDYALSLNSYQNAFDKAFPDKNHWGRVDSVSYKSIDNFGIKYIVSDYNINYPKARIQNKIEEILPVINGNWLRINFTAQGSNLEQIRILTANYNRLNSCSLKFYLYDEIGKERAQRTVECKDLRDKMFYTIDLKSVLAKGDRYELRINSPNASEKSHVGLWGSRGGEVFLEALYDDKPSAYPLIWKGKSLYIFETKEQNYINLRGKYSVLNENPESTMISVLSPINSRLEIKRVNYPGWKVYINGIEGRIDKGLFLSTIIPPGDNIVEFRYIPFTFSLGALISFAVFISISIYVIRLEIKHNNSIMLLKKIRSYFSGARILWHHHFFAALIAFFINLIIISIAVFLFPIKFTPHESTAINWFTMNSYPRQQDYFYFFLVFGYLLFSTFILWLLWVIKKHS